MWLFGKCVYGSDFQITIEINFIAISCEALNSCFVHIIAIILTFINVSTKMKKYNSSVEKHNFNSFIFQASTLSTLNQLERLKSHQK